MNTFPIVPPKNPGVFRILHFSDIHTGLKDWKWRYLLDKRFFGRLNQFATRQRELSLENIALLTEHYADMQVDAALCTGDLTSIGSQEEFQHAEEILAPLRQKAGENFLYVPGNHDAYIPQNHPALAEAFKNLNQGRCELTDLPQSVTIGPVEFILLNPARPCAIWLSTGALSADGWNKLDYILSLPARARVRVVATHFPLSNHTGHALSWRTKLENGEHLLEHGRKGAFQAILSGHVHLPFILPPDKEGFWQIGAGSLTLRDSFSLIDIDSATGAITPQIIKLNPL